MVLVWWWSLHTGVFEECLEHYGRLLMVALGHRLADSWRWVAVLVVGRAGSLLSVGLGVWL